MSDLPVAVVAVGAAAAAAAHVDAVDDGAACGIRAEAVGAGAAGVGSEAWLCLACGVPGAGIVVVVVGGGGVDVVVGGGGEVARMYRRTAFCLSCLSTLWRGREREREKGGGVCV